jgi:Family of unknown function (DUF6789)
MSHLIKAIIAGFIATSVMTILIFIKHHFGAVSELNFVEIINNMNTNYFGLPETPWGAWLVHFCTGSLVYGVVFAYFNPMLTDSNIFNGIIIAIGAWFVMMLVILPLTGGGLFGVVLGEHARLTALVLHGVYGAVLGFSYTRLRGA